MKTNRVIKIFLASSEELEADRYRFGNLIRKLDNIYEKRGIRIELFEWEDYDAAYNGMRKQDEYNERVRASDMFLALFHKKSGKIYHRGVQHRPKSVRRAGFSQDIHLYKRPRSRRKRK